MMGKVKRYFDVQENTTQKSTNKKAFKGKNAHSFKAKKLSKKKPTFGKKSHTDRPTGYKANNRNSKFNRSKPTKLPPVPEKVLQKFNKGPGIRTNRIRTGYHRAKIEHKEKLYKFATKQTARNDLILSEEPGYLVAEPGETTTQFTQQEILKHLDITTATKHFDLRLNDFGPYRLKYTRNGRHMLIGGKLGHVAAFDCITKKLHCEINVMESVHDICWLHVETMYAVAQKSWVYLYDNKGIEMHCIKKLDRVNRMEFLPYHFLLACCGENGYLSWLDVSIGQMVSSFHARLGPLSLMTQNPWNAVMCLGHSKGIVTMWSPKCRDSLAKMLCHAAPLSALHVNPSGTYMATGSYNQELKIWDIRKLDGPLQKYKLNSSPNNLAFSQNNLLAVGLGNVVEIYKDCCTKKAYRPYFRHRFVTQISNFGFCPFEDVFGVGTETGITSLIVPGAGYANFDGLEVNPYQTKSQRREFEVKALLEKIQPELINLDPTSIVEINVPSLKEKIEEKQQLLFVKPPRIDFKPRNKAKGRGGSVKVARNKKIVQEEAKKVHYQNVKQTLSELQQHSTAKKAANTETTIFDRFLPKTKIKK